MTAELNPAYLLILQIAALSKDGDHAPGHGDEAVYKQSGDDAIATLNILISDAREIVRAS